MHSYAIGTICTDHSNDVATIRELACSLEIAANGIAPVVVRQDP